MKASSVSLHPRRFLPRLSAEHVVFTEIYECRNSTGMEYIEQNRTESNQIEGLSSITFGNHTH